MSKNDAFKLLSSRTNHQLSKLDFLSNTDDNLSFYNLLRGNP